MIFFDVQSNPLSRFLLTVQKIVHNRIIWTVNVLNRSLVPLVKVNVFSFWETFGNGTSSLLETEMAPEIIQDSAIVIGTKFSKIRLRRHRYRDRSQKFPEKKIHPLLCRGVGTILIPNVYYVTGKYLIYFEIM